MLVSISPRRPSSRTNSSQMLKAMVVWAGMTMALSRPFGFLPSSIWNWSINRKIKSWNSVSEKLFQWLCLFWRPLVDKCSHVSTIETRKYNVNIKLKCLFVCYPHCSASHPCVDSQRALTCGPDALNNNTKYAASTVLGLTDQAVIKVHFPEQKSVTVLHSDL